MNRTIGDIQKDIELLGIKGGYDIEQLLTPQDCRRLSYEIKRLNNIIDKKEQFLGDNIKRLEREVVKRDNIINELEKYCNEEIEDYDKHINSKFITDIAREQYEGEKVCFEDMLDKLQELKGDESNEIKS